MKRICQKDHHLHTAHDSSAVSWAFTAISVTGPRVVEGLRKKIKRRDDDPDVHMHTGADD